MYFSKNSRYVLQRAKWLSSSSYFLNRLKGKKNLSFKFPKDDPSKPPLRVNIPKDPHTNDSTYSKLLQNSEYEPSRSKNHVKSKTPALGPHLEEDFLKKSESEIQMPFCSDIHPESRNETFENLTDQTSYCQSNPSVDSGSKGFGYTEDLTSVEDNPIENTTPKNYVESTELDQTVSGKKNEVKAAKKELENVSEVQNEENCDPNALYIIIDVPEKQEEKFAHVNTAESFHENKLVPPPFLQDDFATVKSLTGSPQGPKQPKLKVDWRRSSNGFKGKGKKITKMSSFKPEAGKQLNKPDPKMRFEVHEIDDAATYIFHLKFKKNFRGKPTTVGWVPEKELNTRTFRLHNKDSTVQPLEGGRSIKSLGKDVTGVEDSPEWVNYAEAQNQSQNRVSKDEIKEDDKIKSQAQVNTTNFCNLSADGKSGNGLEFESLSEQVQTLEDKQKLEVISQAAIPEVTSQVNQSQDSNTTFTPDLETSSKKEPSAVFEGFPTQNAIPEYAAEIPTVSTEAGIESTNSKEEEVVAATQQDFSSQQSYPTEWYPSSLNTEYSLDPEPTTTEVNTKGKKLSKKKKSSKKLNKGAWIEKKKRLTSKLAESHFHSDSKIGGSKVDNHDGDVTDFKTTSSVITISSEKPFNYPARFSAAFPPSLCEVFHDRTRTMGFKGDSLFHHKWTNKGDFKSKDCDINPKCLDANKVSQLSENSILFPKNEKENFNCSLLLTTKKDVILNVGKAEKDDAPKISDNIMNVANEDITENKGKASVDSLAMMKKVKEIVNFDLNNAIKIFDGRQPESSGEVSSQKGNDVNQISIDPKLNKTSDEIKITEKDKEDIQPRKNDSEEEYSLRLDETSIIPKYLPTKNEKRTIMKLNDKVLDSVVTFSPTTGKFLIDIKELEEAVEQRSEVQFDETVIKKLEEIMKEDSSTKIAIHERSTNKRKYEMKSGDSILVFDEETQTWKVDYSILEKREEQRRNEQELMKRSELILETFEKLEQGQVSGIPKPDSRERRVFDYNTEEWKIYHPEKKTKVRQKSAKLPFKETDAEGVRKKNSDLYEDLFVSKKKKKINKNKKNAPGLDSSGTKKEGKAYSTTIKKQASDTGSTPRNPDNINHPTQPKESPKETPVHQPENQHRAPQEDDNFWGSFLNMNILPRTISEIPTVKVPPPPPPAPPKSPKIEPPKTKIPAKKIEEPRFRISIPFIGDKKPEDSNKKKPPTTKGGPKPEKPSPPSGIGGAKKEEPKIKAPPPAPPQRKDDPKSKTPPTIGSSKAEDPKSKPPPSTESPKVEDPKSKPPPTMGSPKSENSKEKPSTEVPKVKAPPASPKAKVIQHPKSKTPPSSADSKRDKNAADHYVSENIVEMSRNTNTEKNSKVKPNKIETVKLNITSDKRMPSKITEINLNKKCDEKLKETQKQTPSDQRKVESSLKKPEKSSIESKNFYRNFEKYKTPFSDPEYEEKSMKINSDIESNPNLKKLDNWNKTLVLQDLVKPPENIESWLKDETDKMATLLLKVLQEAADGKPRRKAVSGKSKPSDKSLGKGNPYDNIRKKQETTAETFLYKIRPMNLDPESGAKGKIEEKKLNKKPDSVFKEIPVQSGKTVKPAQVVDVVKISPGGKESLLSSNLESFKSSQALPQSIFEEPKPKFSEVALETVDSFLEKKETLPQNRVLSELTDEIPGPEILKKISNTWKLFPILGCQMTIFTLFRIFQLMNAGATFFSSANPEKSRRHNFSKLFTKYGPIVNVQGPLSGNVILIHKPEHLIGVFEQDVGFPVRSVFDSLEQIRLEAEEKVQSAAISTDWSKPEWTGLKRALNDPLSKGCEKFFSGVDQAGESLISNMRRNRNGQNFVSEDFMEEIKRWSTEGLCNFLFEKSFNFLEGRNNTNWHLEPDKLYMAIEETTEYLSKCERGFQAWRIVSTPSSVGLGQAYGNLSGLLSKQLYQAELNLKKKSELLKNGNLIRSRDLTFIESMLLYDGTTMDEVTCNLIDIILIGMNTMSSALGFLLYNLAQNTKVQHKLLKEVKETLPEKNSRLDYHKLHSLKYLQACLKESLRLHMPIPIFFRMLHSDILLSNYIIPKGTYIVMDSKNSCMKEQIFDEPEKFIPERWLNEEKWMQNVHPFSTFPFCHGPRGGLAKRIVEMQLWSCAAKIVRNFQIEYQFGEIQGTESIISFPDKPLKLNFLERDE